MIGGTLQCKVQCNETNHVFVQTQEDYECTDTIGWNSTHIHACVHEGMCHSA